MRYLVLLLMIFIGLALAGPLGGIGMGVLWRLGNR